MIIGTRRRCLYLGIAVWLTASHATSGAPQTTNALPLESLAGVSQAGSAPGQPTAQASPASPTLAGAGAQVVQHFVHRSLGFSLDIPVEWTVRETESGLNASRIGSALPFIFADGVVEPTSGALKQQFREGQQTVCGHSCVMTNEFLQHPQGDAVLRVLREIRPDDKTSLYYEFLLDAGNKRWTFQCGDIVDGLQPNGHIPACVTAARTFRAGAVPAGVSGPTRVAAESSGVRTITFVEGPSLVVPRDFQGGETHQRPSTKSGPKTVGFQVSGPDVYLELRLNPAPPTELAALRVPPDERARRSLPPGPISDFDIPGARAFVFQNPGSAGRTTYLFWVELGGIWAFQCTELSAGSSGSCVSLMRSFQIRPAAMTQRTATDQLPVEQTTTHGSGGRIVTPGISSHTSGTSAGAGTMQPVNTDWSRVPGLERSAPEDRTYALKEATGFYNSCESPRAQTSDLGNLYECSCIARATLTARLSLGFEKTLIPDQASPSGWKPEMKVNSGRILSDMVTGRTNINACIAPEKVARWGADWYSRLWSSFRRIDPEDSKEDMTNCVGRSLAETYQRKPGPDIGYLGGLASEAAIRCRGLRGKQDAPKATEARQGAVPSSGPTSPVPAAPARPSGSAPTQPAAQASSASTTVSDAGAQVVQHFVHRSLGFSLDIPAGWTVRETASGFHASQGGGAVSTISAVNAVEPRSRTLREQFHEGRETIGRGETTVEFLQHPQGEAVLRVNRTIARVPSGGDMTMLSYDFYLDVGDRRWTFHCGDMLTGAHPSDHLPACLTAARTFRVNTDSPTAAPGPN